MHKWLDRIAAAGFGVLLTLAGPAGCGRDEPVRIGFVGCLTGRLSDLGLSGRNGALLAVEKANADGGIDGRTVELLVRDDRHDPQTALRVDRELIDAGVAAIIGHMTSTITMQVLPLVNEARVVMLSPTTSTSALDGRDDYFLRVIEASTAEADHLAGHAARVMGLRRVRAAVDLSNADYTRMYAGRFARELERNGARMLEPVRFYTGEVTSYGTLAAEMLKSSPDGLLIVSSALDAAMICQQVRKQDPRVPILVAGWAHTPEFIQQGGRAVDGVLFSQTFDPEGRQPGYVAFRERYVERFSREPDFAALLSYEAATLLVQTLRMDDDPARLKQTLLGRGRIPGLQGDLGFDRYGDVRRARFLIRVDGNRYRTVATAAMAAGDR